MEKSVHTVDRTCPELIGTETPESRLGNRRCLSTCVASRLHGEPGPRVEREHQKSDHPAETEESNKVNP